MPWPDKRLRVAMGTLTLTNVAADQPLPREHISFNPCRLYRASNLRRSDPGARRDAYEESRQRRGGTPCPFKIVARSYLPSISCPFQVFSLSGFALLTGVKSMPDGETWFDRFVNNLPNMAFK